jgi:hypothetical protein
MYKYHRCKNQIDQTIGKKKKKVILNSLIQPDRTGDIKII